jgi:hypothetical protein
LAREREKAVSMDSPGRQEVLVVMKSLERSTPDREMAAPSSASLP